MTVPSYEYNLPCGPWASKGGLGPRAPADMPLIKGVRYCWVYEAIVVVVKEKIFSGCYRIRVVCDPMQLGELQFDPTLDGFNERA